MRPWLREPAIFPVQENMTFGWKGLSFLAAIFLHRNDHGSVRMGKMTKT